MEDVVRAEIPANESQASRLAPIEQIVAKMWRTALHVDELCAEDNFYELGGDSIMMMTIISRVRGEFGVDLATRALWESPTLGEFCLMIANKCEEAAGDEDLEQAIL
jgi:aryl carrier-like protein